MRMRILCFVAIAGFVFYIGWNFYWLLKGVVPPSIALKLFGFAAPTTGMTRSTAALLAGDWQASLYWNACTIPTLLLLLVTPLFLLHSAIRSKRLRIPEWLGWTWMIVLALAWMIKLLQGPAYW